MSDSPSPDDTKRKEKVPYASDRYIDRYPCAECGLNNIEVRVHANPNTFDAKWLCRNCARDYTDRNSGYTILEYSIGR